MLHHYKKTAIAFFSVIQSVTLVVSSFCYLKSFEFRADIYSTCFQGNKVASQNKVSIDMDTAEIVYCGEKRKIGKKEFR